VIKILFSRWDGTILKNIIIKRDKGTERQRDKAMDQGTEAQRHIDIPLNKGG
jgi:hypothetical protein